MKNLYNINELSKLLNISTSTLYRWVHRKEIPFVKLGGRLLFEGEKIQEFIKQKKDALNSLMKKVKLLMVDVAAVEVNNHGY